MFRRGVRRQLTLSTLSAMTLLLSIFSPISLNQASAAPALITCVNIQTGTERISYTGKCRYAQEAQANWHKIPSDSPIASGTSAKVIVICSNKESSPVSYQVIRKKCARHQATTIFSRSGALPSKPAISQVVAYGHDNSQISLVQNPATNPDAPIAFYTVTSSKGNTQKVYSWKDLSLVITGLQAQTTYTFTVSATTADGTSPISAVSLPVTTPAYVPPTPTTAPLAAPAFTLSSSSETKTVNNAITGYTITSSGGAIDSYAISPAAPAGLTFSTSTGRLSGTPTSSASATAYTITATNATGSATRIFTLTVTAVVYTVGQTGPGGGTVIYVATTPFVCGPTRAKTCTYLEVAPNGWNTGSDPQRSWAQSTPVDYQTTTVGSSGSPETATATGIGWGYFNTRAIIRQGNTDIATSAAALADSHTVTVSSVVYDDWYLPSNDELTAIYDNKAFVGGLFLGFDWYWSSSESGGGALMQMMGSFNAGPDDKSSPRLVRPIRAF